MTEPQPAYTLDDPKVRAAAGPYTFFLPRFLPAALPVRPAGGR